MSKQNPNQDFYKIGGRSQTDGPDRGDALGNNLGQDRDPLPHDDKKDHPAVKRSAKKK